MHCFVSPGTGTDVAWTQSGIKEDLRHCTASERLRWGCKEATWLKGSLAEVIKWLVVGLKNCFTEQQDPGWVTIHEANVSEELISFIALG